MNTETAQPSLSPLEPRCRRLAKRKDLRLVKLRGGWPKSQYGPYMIVNAWTAGAEIFGLSIKAAIGYLREEKNTCN